MTATDLYIDGKWTPAKSGKTFAVENPAGGNVIANVADGGATDGDRAIRAAAGAQPTWAYTSPRERSEILRRAYDLILERTDDLAASIIAEMGKPLAEARGEVAYGAEFFAGSPRRQCGSTATTRRLATDATASSCRRGRPGVCAGDTVELSAGDGYSQDRPGDRRGRHDCCWRRRLRTVMRVDGVGWERAIHRVQRCRRRPCGRRRDGGEAAEYG